MHEKAKIPFSKLPIWKEIPASLETLYGEALRDQTRKIVVLDDDPTGIQTVYDISVFTDWDETSIRSGFQEEKNLFYIMTNSRGMTSSQSESATREIARRICKISNELGRDFVVISRSDSTLRGHWPMETEVLRQTIEQETGKSCDGEVIMPFFLEGGRFTFGDIHYVKDGDLLIPAGETEFAKDKTFGYSHSHIGRWCEEKTNGRYKAEDCIYIGLEMIRSLDIEAIVQQLMAAKNFAKIIVNTVSYDDVKVFCIAMIRAIRAGKEFVFRTAAAWPKIFGGIGDHPLLTHRELVRENENGGIILVGSHVNKTTRQLEHLRESNLPIEFMEFDAALVKKTGGLQAEAQRVADWAEGKIREGHTTAIYTTREQIDFAGMDKEQQLEMSVAISDAVTGIIKKLTIKPAFIVAKGGITSSDVGVNALGVKKASVMGQIMPGVPVWLTGGESKFPGMPYVIFPGNVGDEGTLTEAVRKLMYES